MFSWNIEDGGLFSFGAGIGGPEPGPAGHIGSASDEHGPGVSIYIQVRDLAESQTLAPELGGEATFPPFDVPGGPTLAGIRDPEGNPIVLVQQ